MVFKGQAPENNAHLTGCMDPWTRHLAILSFICLVGKTGMRLYASGPQKDKIHNVKCFVNCEYVLQK